MRHVFILNPAAGKHHRALDLVPRIKAYFAAHPADYLLHETTAPGEATAFVRQCCAEGVPTRFYACGGDGTLIETAAGLRGCAHAELTAIPCGSANDYIRSFGDEEAFHDLPRLIGGTVREVDGIRCGDYLALNICAMGMDANVAYKMTRYKHLPLVSGPMAYQLAVLDVFCHRFGRRQRVVMDTPEGEITREGVYLFSLAASGQYYGGGYHAAPTAQPDDGLLDFVLVDCITRPKIPGFLKRYRAGTHLSMPIVQHFRGTRMQVFCDEPTVVTADGECFTDTHIVFELAEKAFRFAVPAAAAPAPVPAAAAEC